jgi:hypothetical protein
MWQRSFVLEDPAKVAHVDPAIARGALNEMVSLVPGLFANARPDDFAALDVHATNVGMGRCAGRPVFAAN